MNLAQILEKLFVSRDKGVVNLTAQGVAVDATAGIDEIMDQILEIDSFGDVNAATKVDNNVSYIKQVPVNSVSHCYLNSIGGMTYKIADTFTATVTGTIDPGEEHTYPFIEFEYIPLIII